MQVESRGVIPIPKVSGDALTLVVSGCHLPSRMRSNIRIGQSMLSEPHVSYHLACAGRSLHAWCSRPAQCHLRGILLRLHPLPRPAAHCALWPDVVSSLRPHDGAGAEQRLAGWKQQRQQRVLSRRAEPDGTSGGLGRRG